MIYNIFLTQSPESLTIYGDGGGGAKRDRACFNPFHLTEYVVSAFQLLFPQQR